MNLRIDTFFLGALLELFLVVASLTRVGYAGSDH